MKGFRAAVRVAAPELDAEFLWCALLLQRYVQGMFPLNPLGAHLLA